MDLWSDCITFKERGNYRGALISLCRVFPIGWRDNLIPMIDQLAEKVKSLLIQ